MEFLCFILGGFVGIILMALVSANKVKVAEKEGHNAERRATHHFRKLMDIENTIKNDEKNHEYTIYTVKKIKKILQK